MKSVFDPAYQNQNIDARIVVAMERLSEAFRTRLWDENKKHNLSPLQIQIIIFLLYHPEQGAGVKQLADEFNVAKPTASDAVKTLIRKGYLTEEPVATDGRRKILKLTPKGEKTAHQVSFFANRIQDEISPLASDRKKILLESLLDIIYNLQQSGIISTDRMCYRCRFFGQSNDPDKPHYCHLLETPLAVADLRIDCPEFEPAS
jgi:DNA-binding MarR family transcriptional regulator